MKYDILVIENYFNNHIGQKKLKTMKRKFWFWFKRKKKNFAVKFFFKNLLKVVKNTPFLTLNKIP